MQFWTGNPRITQSKLLMSSSTEDAGNSKRVCGGRLLGML